jgi:hypothetical protein
MATQDTAGPISRRRRITGFFLFGLGCYFCAISAFNFARWRIAFDYADWVRFIFILWLGGSLGTGGLWLVYRLRIALLAGITLIVAAVSFAIASIQAG